MSERKQAQKLELEERRGWRRRQETGSERGERDGEKETKRKSMECFYPSWGSSSKENFLFTSWWPVSVADRNMKASENWGAEAKISSPGKGSNRKKEKERERERVEVRKERRRKMVRVKSWMCKMLAKHHGDKLFPLCLVSFWERFILCLLQNPFFLILRKYQLLEMKIWR